MSPAPPTLDDLLAQAISLTDEQRERFRVWDGAAAPGARADAITRVLEAGRQTGRSDQQLMAMDDAYHNVAQSAGVTVPWTWSLFGEVTGPTEPWQPAARVAAETAAALVLADVIAPELLDFVLEPWIRLRRRGPANV